jgi:hypothetical protein
MLFCFSFLLGDFFSKLENRCIQKGMGKKVGRKSILKKKNHHEFKKKWVVE